MSEVANWELRIAWGWRRLVPLVTRELFEVPFLPTILVKFIWRAGSGNTHLRAHYYCIVATKLSC